MNAGFLTDPLLAGWGVEHGFGTRGSAEPAGVVRPRQVHGVRVARVGQAAADPGDADALLTRTPGLAVGVVTADCVPILLVAEAGGVVAAIHAGWRGLAAGVVDEGAGALRSEAAGAEVRAALGPYIGACCYEVDEPVLAALSARFGSDLDACSRTSRPGHARVDLGALVRRALQASGFAPDAIGTEAAACTRCDAERFHSYRRDGSRAGRLLHYVRAPGRS